VASPPTRMKPDRPVVKQQAQAAIGPSGVVGDSARGKISRGAWEALSGGSGSNQRAAGIHNRGGGPAGSRKGPYERRSGVTPVEQRGLTESMIL
jgi:hypothetical protein